MANTYKQPPEDEFVPPPADESIFKEIWGFLKVRKKFWLAPIILALMLLGLLFVVAGQAGVVSPFIYAL
jgi:hypothetical protein